MAQHDLQATVDSLMKHTGLGDKVAADVVAQRRAVRKEAADRLSAGEARWVAKSAALAAQHKEAARRADEATKLAAAEMQAENKISEARSTEHDTFAALRASLWPILRATAEPEIAEFITELRAARETSPSTHPGTHAEMTARVVAFSNAIEAAERLQVDPSVDAAGVPAAIAKIRATIEGA